MSMATLLLIDRQKEWLDFARGVLEEAGYEVVTSSHYDLAAVAEMTPIPTLSIIGCQTFGDDELQLLEGLSALRHLVLVVGSASATVAAMRRMFRLGAIDVTAKPQSRARILTLVQQTLKRMENRDSYQLMAPGLQN